MFKKKLFESSGLNTEWSQNGTGILLILLDSHLIAGEKLLGALISYHYAQSTDDAQQQFHFRVRVQYLHKQHSHKNRCRKCDYVRNCKSFVRCRNAGNNCRDKKYAQADFYAGETIYEIPAAKAPLKETQARADWILS